MQIALILIVGCPDTIQFEKPDLVVEVVEEFAKEVLS